MKRADASGAEFAAIVGEAEAAAGSATIKALRAADSAAPFAQQRAVAVAELGETLSVAMAAAGSVDNERISGTN
jgi:histidyl-tRNA synthetase